MRFTLRLTPQDTLTASLDMVRAMRPPGRGRERASSVHAPHSSSEHENHHRLLEGEGTSHKENRLDMGIGIGTEARRHAGKQARRQANDVQENPPAAPLALATVGAGETEAPAGATSKIVTREASSRERSHARARAPMRARGRAGVRSLRTHTWQPAATGQPRRPRQKKKGTRIGAQPRTHARRRARTQAGRQPARKQTGNQAGRQPRTHARSHARTPRGRVCTGSPRESGPVTGSPPSRPCPGPPPSGPPGRSSPRPGRRGSG